MNSRTKNHTTEKNKEKISLKKFKTMEALKSEIRNKIALKEHVTISTNGSFISISFEKKGI